MSLLERFAEIFEMPPAMLPYAHFVVDDREMELVVGLDGQAMTVAQVAEMMRIPPEETEALLTRAYHRDVVEKETEDGVTTYRAGTFYRRLDPLAMYENWGDVPAEARNAVIEWQLEEFINLWLPVVEEIKKDPDAYYKIPNRDVLLLDEALEMVEAATEHVVVPCDCRSIVMACKRPVETCIRLDEGARLTLEHGQGRRITKEKCKKIVINADKKGLMHTGRKAWREHELFGFCNCCACDCYPIRAGMALRMHKQWPRSHYVAAPDWSACVHCGACVKRCHFGAFHHDGSTVEINGKTRQRVQFEPAKCWGCGLCRNTCVWGAIVMEGLEDIA